MLEEIPTLPPALPSSLWCAFCEKGNENVCISTPWDASAGQGAGVDRQGVGAYLKAFPHRAAGRVGTQISPNGTGLFAIRRACCARLRKRKITAALMKPFSSSGACLSGTRLEERRKGVES
jgi:hypothetical protein